MTGSSAPVLPCPLLSPRSALVCGAPSRKAGPREGQSFRCCCRSLTSAGAGYGFFAWGVFLLKRGPLKSAINILVTALVCAILPLSLWTARNYLTFGQLFLIRDDTGMAKWFL